MTALALTPKDEIVVQLGDQAVQDSRLGVLAGAELSSDSLRGRARTLSGGKWNEHSVKPSPTPAPQRDQWKPPRRSSSVEPDAVAAAQAPAQRHGPLLDDVGDQEVISSLPRSTSASSNHLMPLPRSSSSSSLPSNGRTSPGHSSYANGAPSRAISNITNSAAQRISTATASSASGITSNSSFQDPPSSTAPSPRSPQTTSVLPSFPFDPSLDPTAALIQKLYARLDAQGVPGDGWEEGKERSRDGIINREVMEGGETVRGPKALQKLSAQEDSVLKKVDRYGFFSQSHPAALASQHNRLATLSAASYSSLPSSSKRSSKPGLSSQATLPPTDAKRFSADQLMSNISPTAVALETKRIDKWSAMLQVAKRDTGGNVKEWDVGEGWWEGRKRGGGGKYRKLQRRVFKGVPDRWRRAVWGLEIERVARESGDGRLPSLEELESEYQRYLTLPSSQDVQIDLDVPRTISGHVLFHTRYGQGQRALFHVLHALGLHCDDIGGYCQGMGPIAATLLCYFEPERAYAGLVRLFDQYQLRHIFEPGFPGLVEAFYVQERLVELLMPDVHAAFTEHFISTSAYATKWYITLFANSVPFATQLRFWDGLLLEGLDFLVITAVAVIWCFKDQFTARDASFESILSILSSYFFVESDDALLRWIRKTLRRKDLRQQIAGWRREWRGFVVDGSAARRVT